MYAVISINEDGFVTVFGPYEDRERAERVCEQIYEDDIEQKVTGYVKTLYFYETEGGTVV